MIDSDTGLRPVLLLVVLLLLLHDNWVRYKEVGKRKQQNGPVDHGSNTHQKRTRQVDELKRGVLPTFPLICE